MLLSLTGSALKQSGPNFNIRCSLFPGANLSTLKVGNRFYSMRHRDSFHMSF